MLIPIAIILLVLYLYAAIEYATGMAFLMLPGKFILSLKYLHFGLLALLVALGFMAYYNIYLRGYWTTKILIWICLFAAMALFAFRDKGFQSKVERIYYGLIFYSPVLTIISIAIPFLGVHILLTVFYCSIGTKDDIEYSDNNYRLQNTYHGFLAIPSPPDLFVKRGILEYRQKPLEIEYLGKCEKITVENVSDKEVIIVFQKCKLFEDTSSHKVAVYLDQ